MALPPLATTQDLSDYLQGQTIPAAAASLAIAAASAIVRGYTGQQFTLVTDDTVTLYGTADPDLILPQLPAQEPTSVVVDGTATTDWVFRGDRLYRPFGWLVPWPTTDGRVWPVAYLVPSVQVQVTYTHGYSEIPDDVRAVVLAIAARQATNPAGIAQERIGDYSYARATADLALTSAERMILGQYGRRIASTRVC